MSNTTINDLIDLTLSDVNVSDANETNSGLIIPYLEVWTPSAIQRVATLAVLMVISLVGNTVIIIILTCSRYRKCMSRVNLFIVHLAIGDLAVCCITMTSEVLFEVFGEWMLGNVACKVIVYTQIVTLGSTTFLLMAMSWDRYQAICRPLQFNTSTARARRIILGAWLAAFVTAVPYLFIFVQVLRGHHPDGQPVYVCASKGYTAEWQRKVNFVWLTSYVLVFPAFLISFCYISVARVVWQQGNYQKCHSRDGCSTTLRKTCDQRAIPRAKIKTIKMSLCIILTFVVCWTPYFVVHNLRVFTNYKLSIPGPVKVLVETLALLNSAINPIIYGCFNLRVRQGLKEACCSRIYTGSNHSEFDSSSTVTLYSRQQMLSVRFKSPRHQETSPGCHRAASYNPKTSTSHHFNNRCRSFRNGMDSNSTYLHPNSPQTNCSQV